MPASPRPFAPSPFTSPSSNRTRTIAVVVVAAVVTLIAGYAATAALGSSGSRYPDAWDPRIEPLVRFVEAERGAPFRHPVHVDFVPAETFDESVSYEPTDEERAEAERYSGLYRAFGLAGGELDLFATTGEAAAANVLAYYSPETERITIEGTELTAGVRVTVVHELVHAWQDQILDLQAIEDRIDFDAYDAYLAAVEGDATRMEHRFYWEVLTDEERAEVDAEIDAAIEAASSTNTPRVLAAEMQAPYSLGHVYVEILAAVRGDTAIDDAIQNPPSSTKVLIDPFSRLAREEPVALGELSVGSNEEAFDRGSLGALFLYLVLNERLGSKDALAAVDGWSGDSFVAFTRDARTCVRVDIHASTPEGLQRLSDGLSAWAAAMPAGAAQLTFTQSILLETCDPGAQAALAPPAQPDVDPLAFPIARMSIALSILNEGAKTEFARCATDQFVGQLTMEHVMAEDDRFDAEMESFAENAGIACAHLS